MIRRSLLALSLLASLGLSAQTYTTVTAATVLVDNGVGTAVHPPAGSLLCFLGVDNAGATITYTPSGGSPTSGAVCQTLDSSGALTGVLQVANAATAYPPGLFYTISVTNGFTKYLVIPAVSVSGTVFDFDSYAMQGSQVALGIGFAHLACTYGARWTSTTLPLGQNAQACNTNGQWGGYPPNPYCPSGNAWQVPQSGGTPFCLPAAISGNGAPFGFCVTNSNYYQQDATPGANLWSCISGAWIQQAGGGGGGSGITQLTNDVLAGPGSGSQVATLKVVNSSPGLCGDSTHVSQIDVDAKGRTLSCTPVAIAALTHPWACQPGFGDGLNAMAAGTYLQSVCKNNTGSTITISGIKCFTDNNGTSTMNVTNSAGVGMLASAVTCTSSFASGTQSGTTTLASGDYLKFIFAADGTSKQTTFTVQGSY